MTTINADLIEAVAGLDPQPRKQSWASLSLDILDAVWSIGARYDSVVVPLVENVARHFRLPSPYVDPGTARATDLLPLSRLEELGLAQLTELTNRQLTSTRSGILKSDAVLRHIAVFRGHGIEDRLGLVEAMADETRFAALNTALRKIPGEGSYGIRRGYLWMLVGSEDLIKPDRMVLKWLRQHGVVVDPAGARTLIRELVPAVNSSLGREVTAWEIDHAMWKAARSR